MSGKQFVVKVANVQFKDKTNDLMALKGKTSLDTALSQTIENLEITGGQGSKLLYDYSYGKKLNLSIEDASWREEYIALSNGTSIATGAQDYWIYEESVTLTAGAGEVAQTPVGNLYVEKSDGTLVTVTPTAKAFTIDGGAATTVKVNYQYNVSVNSITISADDMPNVYECTLFTEIVDNDGKVADIQIIIYNFKPSGNFDMSFGSGKAATSKLDGKALANDDDNYAIILIKPVVASDNFTMIASTPAEVTLASGTQQITTIGVRGGLYSNVTVAASACTYVSSATGVCTVDAGGLITYVGDGSANVTVTHTATSLTDVIEVTCLA